ncbi:MAG: AMP-binding protein, partial [Acidimicrobiia bacterium]
VVLPMNPSYRGAEIESIVRHARPKAALVDQSEYEKQIARAIDDQVAFLSPDADLTSDVSVDELDRAEPDDPALLCYTSGTTGAPKGALLSHGNILAGVESVRIAWRWEPADRLLLALPLFHVHGLGVGLHGTLLAGASAVVMPRFDSEALLQAIDETMATLFLGVPQMYSRLVASREVERMAKLRLCVSGSAPLSPDLFKAISELAKQVPLERYGMSETLMNVSNPYEGERRAGTVGFPLPGVRVELTSEGEILLSGPNVFGGYFQNESATSSAFDSNGRFKTGDIGEFDTDGYLKIVGRSKELIITGGFNVYPREVEDVLREHPAVLDVAVIGTPSEEWGEAVTAFVIAGEKVPDQALVEFAGARLVAYKVPKLVRFVESIPRNALGKVISEELRRIT